MKTCYSKTCYEVVNAEDIDLPVNGKLYRFVNERGQPYPEIVMPFQNLQYRPSEQDVTSTPIVVSFLWVDEDEQDKVKTCSIPYHYADWQQQLRLVEER